MIHVLNHLLLLAQEAAPAAAEAAAGAEEKKSIIDIYFKGGWVMHPILFCSIIAFIIILERWWVLNRAKIDTAAFLTRIRQALLKDRDVRKAIAHCETEKSPIASILKAGLLKFGASRDEIEKQVENAAIHEMGRLEKRMAILPFIINMAPMLGFFGTVIGMIDSFDKLARYGLTNPALVAEGISVALITTAGGLIVSIAVLPFFSAMTARIARYGSEMETCANILLETFDEMENLAD